MIKPFRTNIRGKFRVLYYRLNAPQGQKSVPQSPGDRYALNVGKNFQVKEKIS
jgi:hypothetical protein